MNLTQIKILDITTPDKAQEALQTVYAAKEVVSELLNGYGERTDFPYFNATRNVEGNKMVLSFSKDETEPTFNVDVEIFNQLMEVVKGFASDIGALAEAREKEVVSKYNELINS